MNLNEHFFDDSRRERIWGNLSNIGSPGFRSGLPFVLIFQGATEGVDANGGGLRRVVSVCTEEYATSRKWGETKTR